MFSIKPKIKELPSGEDLYQKLTDTVRERDGRFDNSQLSQMIPEIKIEKIYFYIRAYEDQVFSNEAIFLTKNKEAGVLEIENSLSAATSSNFYYLINYGYFSNDGLKLQKNYLDVLGGEKAKPHITYSMDMDTVYSLSKKLERINHDLVRSKLRKIAKQLLRQKIT